MNILKKVFRANLGLQLTVLFTLKLILVLIGIPVLQTLFPGHWQTGHWPDGYDNLAMNLIQGNGYRFFPETSETLLRMPGFPLVLAATFAMFGKSLVAVQAFNVICSTLAACVAIYLTRLITHSRDMATMAAVITIFYPGVFISDGRGGPESMYMLCVVLTLAILYTALWKECLLGYAYFGLALGFTLLIKTTIALLPGALFVYLICKKKSWRGICFAFKAVALSSLVALIVLSPWILRNYVLTSKFVPTTSLMGVAAFQGLYLNQRLASQRNVHEILQEAAIEQNKIANEMQLEFKPGFFQYFYDPKDELKFYNHLVDRSFEEYLASPSLLITGIAANSFHFWFQGRTTMSTMINTIVVAPFLILSLVGTIMAIRKRFQIAPLLLTVAALIAPHSLLIGLARYHVPVIPLLAVLASIAIVVMGQHWFGADHKRKVVNDDHTKKLVYS